VNSVSDITLVAQNERHPLGSEPADHGIQDQSGQPANQELSQCNVAEARPSEPIDQCKKRRIQRCAEELHRIRSNAVVGLAVQHPIGQPGIVFRIQPVGLRRVAIDRHGDQKPEE